MIGNVQRTPSQIFAACSSAHFVASLSCRACPCMTAGNAVIVFARLPVPGNVKTRLAAGVGADLACSFYAACAAHTFRQAVG